MCKQIDNVWKCGHRGFAKFDNCANFGTSCYGASGDHAENKVDDNCADCKRREQDKNNNTHRKDPWGKDDPYKQQK